MATRKTKGRGAPGKAKSKAHREALSKALKAFHAKRKGKGKTKTTKRKTSASKTSVRRTRTANKDTTKRRSASRVSSYPVDIINGHEYNAKTGELKKSNTIYTIGKNGRKYPLKSKKSLTPAEYLARKRKLNGG